MRDSFIFYRSFLEAADSLDNGDKAALLDAIIRYALNDEKPQLKGVVSGMFGLIKPQIDANTRRYKNGLKGGAPEGNANAKKADKQPKNNLKTTKKQPKNNQTTTEKQANDNDNENEKENVNENDNENGLGCFEPSLSTTTSFFGHLKNVELTDEQYRDVADTYEDATGLIDKVSAWLKSAKGPVPDHYGLVLKFAANDKWPKKRKLKKPPPEREIAPEDAPTAEELAELVAKAKRTIGFNPVG